MIDIDLLTNNIPASTDQFAECMYSNKSRLSSLNIIILAVPVQVDIKTQSRIVLDQMLKQVFRIIDGLPLDPHTLCQSLQPFGMIVEISRKISFEDWFF